MSRPLSEAVAGAAGLTGTVLTLPGATSAELLGEPFDVIWIDLEHAPLGPLDAQDMIIGAQAAGTYAMVRLPADAYGLITTMLDAGADGVVLADVADAATATRALSHMFHPPDGDRGWGPRRLSLRRRGSEELAFRPSVWAQIESAAGAERANDIAALPGIDALVVGTADLSFSVGRPLDSHAPELLHAVDLVRKACLGAGVVFGIAGALDAAPARAYEGARLLVHSTDARLCARAVDSSAEWLRTLLSPGSGA